jgi:polysaccharide deacetylase family protein (PEP-CTERM system associated)
MNLLGIDFEEWFHPELIQKYIKKTDHELSVVNGIDKILDLLTTHDTYATFFMVGELIESRPELIDKILDNGHEIGFHTMYHDRLDSMNNKQKFVEELKKFAKLTSKKSKGFRAPSFSLNNSSAWAIDALVENGYQYDSSIVPAKTKLYGMPNAELKPYKITSKDLEKNNENGKIIEFPLLTRKFFNYSIPVAGGFFIRLLPLRWIETAIKNNENKKIPSTFYIHSWELTPEYMKKIPLSKIDNFITYHNLEKTSRRLEKLLKKFEFTSFDRFISKNNNLSNL